MNQPHSIQTKSAVEEAESRRRFLGRFAGVALVGLIASAVAPRVDDEVVQAAEAPADGVAPSPAPQRPNGSGVNPISAEGSVLDHMLADLQRALEKRARGEKVRFGMAVDLKKCTGCRACTVACKAENVTPPEVSYNVVLEQEVGTYPNVKRVFTYKPCFHCENPPCTPVCPVGATWKRKEDGIVVIDYDICIGCRYCLTACPYGSRFIH